SKRPLWSAGNRTDDDETSVESFQFSHTTLRAAGWFTHLALAIVISQGRGSSIFHAKPVKARRSAAGRDVGATLRGDQVLRSATSDARYHATVRLRPSSTLTVGV